MAGYLGTKAVLLSTTAADVTGNAEIGGDLTVGGNLTSTGLDVTGDNAILYIRDTKSATFVGGEEMGRLGWYVEDTSGIGPRENAYVKSVNGPTGGATTSSNLAFGTAAQNETATTRMTLTADGDVGIGTGSPQAKLHVSNGSAGFEFAPDGIADGTSYFQAFDRTAGTYDSVRWYALTHQFYSGNNEAARIDASGNLLINQTSTSRSAKLRVDLDNATNGTAVYISRLGGTVSKAQIEFANDNGVVGKITSSGSSTAYNTSSDYRLKTDAQQMTGASARVQALNPVNFEWIVDGTRVDGFLAHEAQEVVPESVTGTKDAMRDEEYEVTPAVLDDDGNETTAAVMGTRSVPDYQAIDQSKLVPLLTAALQEALTKIDDMETRLATLEAV